MRITMVLGLFATLFLAGCATTEDPPKTVEAPAEVAKAAEQIAKLAPEEKQLKRKVAIGRFSNETNYGRALSSNAEMEAMGRQTSDILTSRLIETGKFIVLERPDLGVLAKEAERSGQALNVVGSDTLILGALTEFGRTTEGQTGFLSNTKNQIARAKVEARLVDPLTARAFFAVSGAGEANTESGTVAGFGSRAAYDGTLNDRAISAAITDMINELVTKLEERPWRTDILKLENGRMFISGGERQGLKVGDRLAVMTKGEVVRSEQSGFDIELPGSQIAQIEIIQLFGTDETNEGSIATIISGDMTTDIANLFIAEL